MMRKPGSVLKFFLLSVSLASLLILALLRLSTRRPPTSVISSHDADLVIRPGYPTYETYIQRQLNKTLNPRLRKIWTTRDWDRKVTVFSTFFARLRSDGLLSNTSKALCVGARVGQEVAALRRIGVPDALGLDLVPSPPLVVEGDFHSQPFPNGSFDFEFSNVFDHALYPDRFVAEIERTLRPGGVCVLHVALIRRADKYSANDLRSLRPLFALFHASDLVHVRRVDGFGLDTEVAFRKRGSSGAKSSAVQEDGWWRLRCENVWDTCGARLLLRLASQADPGARALLQEFGLIDKKKLAPLKELIEAIVYSY